MYFKVRIIFLALAALLIGITMADAANAPQCAARIVQGSDDVIAPGPTPPASSMRCG